MTQASPRLICITGPDGSGKTTQISRIAEEIGRRAKATIHAVTIWDMMLDPATRGKVGFQSPAAVDAYLKVLGPTARALFLFHCFHQALELARARKPDILLLNAYWYKYYATEIAHGGDEVTLFPVTALFPEPLLTFYLKVSPEDAFRRKTQLSGYETGFAEPRSQEAFVAFQKKSNVVLDKLADQRGWVPLNGSETKESLTAMIIRRLDET